jgi:hypothetical protein
MLSSEVFDVLTIFTIFRGMNVFSCLMTITTFIHYSSNGVLSLDLWGCWLQPGVPCGETDEGCKDLPGQYLCHHLKSKDWSITINCLISYSRSMRELHRFSDWWYLVTLLKLWLPRAESELHSCHLGYLICITLPVIR